MLTLFLPSPNLSNWFHRPSRCNKFYCCLINKKRTHKLFSLLPRPLSCNRSTGLVVRYSGWFQAPRQIQFLNALLFFFLITKKKCSNSLFWMCVSAFAIMSGHAAEIVGQSFEAKGVSHCRWQDLTCCCFYCSKVSSHQKEERRRIKRTSARNELLEKILKEAILYNERTQAEKDKNQWPAQ